MPIDCNPGYLSSGTSIRQTRRCGCIARQITWKHLWLLDLAGMKMRVIQMRGSWKD